jgi:hypothetical protein
MENGTHTMNAKGRKGITNPGDGLKILEFYDPFLLENNGFCSIFIQSFPDEIRPNKQFLHSTVDGAQSIKFYSGPGRVER